MRIDDRDFSASDKEYLDSHFKTGQKTSDTIEITVHCSDGSAQNSVLSISEDDNGSIVAELN